MALISVLTVFDFSPLQLEGKLQEHGVKKFIPDDPKAIKTAWRINELNKAIAKAAADLPDTPEPPADLAEHIRVKLAENPAMRWDAALIEEIAS